ncbi:MAG: hypothetical protein A2580_08930 [Hydrogenophilales bacterium RIFOXYD1_FULL_62_11]|nr:MAG: hypothetical protein A2580_08930 [Hydrogenophilales bacterium RIFOXYD1_FULL_62_11]
MACDATTSQESIQWQPHAYNSCSATLDPFVPAVGLKVTDAKVAELAQATGIDTRAVRAVMVDEARLPVFINRAYQVALRPIDIMGSSAVHLSIKRRDRQPVHDWRDLQEIKNMLVGPECEGVELFPAESRLVDTANQYHLFASTDPTYRFPFGFSARAVRDDGVAGAVQRPRTQSMEQF